MANVGIFVGSSSGVTQEAAEQLEELFDGAELINMEEDYDDLGQFEEFDVLLIGSSTWGQGDPQRDWVDPLYEMENEEPDFSGKKVAFFGAGDQDTHGEEFISALGKMKDVFSKLGADTEYGYWPTEGYTYKFSRAEKDGKFCGLAIDNVNQADLTEERISTWAEQLKSEMGI
ncbi:flavodoxin [Sulfurovum sp. zt1-1]|uniref:Flavodoxin n=1 Tax=Sulfurovum zhangzhouensis TaxID=3019067 RepID=A0ABT7QVG5_9BACT|nr:flavodoxin [Sulfurovum zhangzhouensis]MDM5270833.1 flavodoxin [Sulfurovum zhangzhouensis]